MNGNSALGFQQIGESDLSIFRMELDADAVFYAPGYLVVAPAYLKDDFSASLSQAEMSSESAAGMLLQQAARARQTYQEISTRPYNPVCLTLYPNNTCNLSCDYCYSMPSFKKSASLSVEYILAAAEMVADNCLEQSVPMTVVFHGGGEPTLDQALVDRALDGVERLASHKGIGLFRYIATNGVMPVNRAAWMARRFDLVGLSCDGPAEVQALQRPLHSGKGSTPWVERTAQLVRAAGLPLHVRVTLAPAWFERQVEIAGYICEVLRPQEIHVEPIYPAGRSACAPQPTGEDAQRCLAGYLAAQKLAASYGVKWTTSGARPGEIHGPYCNCFRDVLNLVPEGLATNCFKEAEAANVIKNQARIGHYDPTAGRFRLESDRLNSMRQRLAVFPEKCQDCFNRYHCTHGCPDICPQQASREFSDFRCEFLRSLVQTALIDTARRLRKIYPNGECVVGHRLDSQEFY